MPPPAAASGGLGVDQDDDDAFLCNLDFEAVEVSMCSSCCAMYALIQPLCKSIKTQAHVTALTAHM